ncbi:hypothetical protein [Bradyrhizobium yuanmingense]|uniref:hypothetical protein n=1 Tax=Bradyrhizobium yuanmingense TaxID=108015 RepID=UPI0023B92B1C|nr:hypothetical protein [Bradyrhizobium yuanmingense]MDF0578896.1 hypothetical protein [Bradyrhizobium yuanmingense]
MQLSPSNLPPERSAELLDLLLSELAVQEGSEGLLAWTKVSLPLKNTLLEADARALEAAYVKKLEETALPDIDPAEQLGRVTGRTVSI